MITDEQIAELKEGDKLIFFRNGGVLNTDKGNVFTYSNWLQECIPEKHYWQCQELKQGGNHEHSFSIYDTELFDEKIHEEFVLMDAEKLKAGYNDFVSKYG